MNAKVLIFTKTKYIHSNTNHVHELLNKIFENCCEIKDERKFKYKVSFYAFLESDEKQHKMRRKFPYKCIKPEKQVLDIYLESKIQKKLHY